MIVVVEGNVTEEQILHLLESLADGKSRYFGYAEVQGACMRAELIVRMPDGYWQVTDLGYRVIDQLIANGVIAEMGKPPRKKRKRKGVS
tara:strand:+ start:1161 stop:1427 length:267 start_codon:yes stop_codon:yes gene_type:complete